MVALGAKWADAGDVPDDDGGFVFGGFGFAGDGGEAVKEEVAVEGHDCGATGRDASLDLEVEEAGEEVVDGGGGLEVGEAGGKLSGEVGGVGLLGRGLAKTVMVRAEVGRGISDEHAAATVAGAALAAAV